MAASGKSAYFDKDEDDWLFKSTKSPAHQYMCTGCNRIYPNVEAAQMCTRSHQQRPLAPSDGTQSQQKQPLDPAEAHTQPQLRDPLSTPAQLGDPLNTPERDDSSEQRKPLLWRSETVKFLIDACVANDVMDQDQSKVELRRRWEQVRLSLVNHGFDASSFKVVRKKWYQLLEKYRRVKDSAASRLGSKAIKWEFYTMMDAATSKYPSSPAVRIQELSWPSQPNAFKRAAPWGDWVPISKKKKASGNEADMQQLYADELKSRQDYREKKLAIFGRIADYLEKMVK